MRLFPAILVCLATLARPSHAGEVPSPATRVQLNSSEDKVLYALGLSLAEKLSGFELTPGELELVQAGLRDGVGGTPAVSLAHWGQRVDGMLARRREAIAAKQRELARDYLARAAAEPGAIRRSSGLIYRELRAGQGDGPAPDSRVKVNYHGTLVDGEVFDSSLERGRPGKFSLASVIKCWTEGVQLMKPGGKAQLVCPPEIAYGQKGHPPKIQPGATLTFEIELLEVLPAQPAAVAK